MKFGMAIKTVREHRGVSQRKLAALINVSHSYISHIEAGTRDPSLKVLSKVSSALSAPIHVMALFAAEEKELFGLSPESAMKMGAALLDEASSIDGKEM